jgi:uncharacterized membrane protein
MAHFHVPATTLRVEDNLWGDHFHPIIVLWGALRAIWPSANALLISQALLVAGAMVPLYLFARDRAGRTAGVPIALAYGTSWGVQRAIDFDVHEIAFAPVLLAGRCSPPTASAGAGSGSARCCRSASRRT